MKTKKSNNLYRKARPGWETEVVNRSGLEKDGGTKNRKKWKFDKLKGGGILQFSLGGKFIREYSSVREATKVLKISYATIHYCLTGRSKTGGNFQWRYKIDPNFDEGIFDIPPMINRLTFKLQPVVQYTMEGKFVKEFSSIKEAAEIFAVTVTSIAQCVRREKKSTKRYQWRLKKDVIKDGKIMDIEPVKRKPGFAVCKFDTDGKFIREYPSMSEAARDEGVSPEAISSRLEKKRCRDYQWRFKEEVEKDGKITDIDPVKPAPNRFLRPVCQFGRDGKFLREYSSIFEAGKDLEIDHEAIYRCLKGFQKTAGDFQWRYKKDPNFDEGILDIPPIINISPYNLQPVVQYTMEGKFVKEFSSIKEAAEILAVPVISIAQCVRREKRSTKGYQWRLKKDVSKDGKIIDIEPVKKPSGLAVCKFDMEGKFIQEYPSMSEAARDEHVSREAISTRLERKKCGDYQWRFKEEVEKDGKIIDIAPLKITRSKCKIKSTKIKSKYLYPVCQYRLDGTFIREYPSIIDAAEKTKIDKNIIFICTVKQSRTTHGFQWRFKEEVVMKDGRIPDIEPSKRLSPFYFHAVCQFKRDGKFIREYPSIIEAAERTNITKYSILACAVRQFKRAGGFLWRFKEEEGKEEKDREKMAGKSRRKPRPYYSQEVCQFDEDGTFIRVYPSIWAAANITDISEYSIFLCASKKTGKRSGYMWRFKKDVVEKDRTIKEIEIKIPSPDIYRYLRAVCQFEKNGKFIREYPSIYAASEKTDITRSVIFSNASRKAKNRDGYLWRFKEDVVDKDGKISDIEARKPIPERFLRPVCQFGRDGKFLREYPSVLDAAQKTRIRKEYIYICTQKRVKTAAGYQWRYKDDPEFKNGITDIAPYERRKPRRRKKKKE